MEQEHIQYAWATNLLGYPISFETNNQIIMADPLARIHSDIAINRIPAYTDAVASADRASILVFVKHGDAYPTCCKCWIPSMSPTKPRSSPRSQELM